MLSYIIYSHSSYNDILKVQNDFCKNITEKKYLFIDKIDNNFNSNFDYIFFYDDNLNYSKRILTCLFQANIKNEFIFFNPDINIIIEKNDKDIYNILDIMKNNNIGRFDLCAYKYIENIENIDYNEYILVKNNDLDNYIYNVGSAIYNTEKYIDLLNNFDYEYRAFELQRCVQEYCLKHMNCYYINCKNPNLGIHCGYYGCTNVFSYIHITHGGELMPIDNNKNNLNNNLQKIYENILNNYKFNRNMRVEMH